MDLVIKVFDYDGKMSIHPLIFGPDPVEIEVGGQRYVAKSIYTEYIGGAAENIITFTPIV